MIAQELLNDVYLVYRGKIQSRTPAWGSDKANVAIAIANRKQREWATDSRNKWNSLFEIASVGTINTSTLTYDLDDTFFASSDYARIVKTDDSVVQYQIVRAQQRDTVSGQALYIHGSDPKKITFAQEIDAGLSGAELFVPGYYIPADIVNSTDTILVDDPSWLVYATASELARNDPSKDDQFATLVGMANEAYLKMSNANNDVGFGQPNSVNSFMPALGNQEDDWTV